MTITGALVLALIMGVLAAIPSTSVALVVARSAAFGTSNGFAASAGIVAGDLIFMTMALMGMTALAEQVGAFFIFVKFAAAAYLIWFGISLIRGQRARQSFHPIQTQAKRSGSTLASSFGAGLLLTLGDVKAIFFYASLLPMFLDLTALTAMEICAISAITIVSVGGVKAAYAIGGRKLAQLANGFAYERELKIVSGGLMVSAGAYLILKD